MNNEQVELVDLGFTIADAAAPEFTLSGQTLRVSFENWQEQVVSFTCADVIAVRWQEAEVFVDDRDRFDSTYVIQNSTWLAAHEQQGHAVIDGFQHFKLNFNAAGQLEFLCTQLTLDQQQQPS